MTPPIPSNRFFETQKCHMSPNLIIIFSQLEFGQFLKDKIKKTFQDCTVFCTRLQTSVITILPNFLTRASTHTFFSKNVTLLVFRSFINLWKKKSTTHMCYSKFWLCCRGGAMVLRNFLCVCFFITYESCFLVLMIFW